MKNHDENQWKSMRIHENPWESMKINENQWESMKINENQWKSMGINENQSESMIFDMLSLHYWFRTHGFQDPQLFYGFRQPDGRRLFKPEHDAVTTGLHVSIKQIVGPENHGF